MKSRIFSLQCDAADLLTVSSNWLDGHLCNMSFFHILYLTCNTWSNSVSPAPGIAFAELVLVIRKVLLLLAANILHH